MAVLLTGTLQLAVRADETDVSAQAIANRAGEQIAKLYPLLEPRLGIYLTDPNVVLVLGGARGYTTFPVYRPQPGDIQAFLKLNEVCESNGIRFRGSEGSCVKDEPCINIYVFSLAGFDLVSSRTKLFDVRHYSANTGWTGFDKWRLETSYLIGKAEYKGLVRDSNAGSIILQGLDYGYPDEAILGVLRVGFHEASTSIPYANYYECAQPNYDYDPKDAVAINKHSSFWGEILHDYYSSAQHLAMRSDPTFMKWRTDYNGPECFRPKTASTH